MQVSRNQEDWSTESYNHTVTVFSSTSTDTASTSDNLPIDKLRITTVGFAVEARATALMEGSALLCRFTPHTDAGNNEVSLAEREAGSWLVSAAVVANNIVSCAADANGPDPPPSAGAMPSGLASHGWHRVTMLTTYMHELGVQVPYESGASFLFYPAPDFQGTQPTHGGYTATGTDAGHSRPQQADAGTLTLQGAFPTPNFLEPSVRPACRVDNDLVVDATVDEALRSATCAFPPHVLGQVEVHFSLNREQWFPLPSEPPLLLEYYGCEPGFFTPQYQADCRRCPAGSMQPLRDQSECVVCGHRAYQPLEGQSRCLPCDDEGGSLWVPTKGGTHRANCTCVPGADADVGDDEAGVARARFVKAAISRQEIVVQPASLSGFYLDTFQHAHGEGARCSACLDGAVCYGERSPPIARPGYYSYAEANYSFYQVNLTMAVLATALFTHTEQSCGGQLLLLVGIPFSVARY